MLLTAKNPRVVPAAKPHRIYRGDAAVERPDKTLKIGNTTIHIVSPKGLSDEDIKRVNDGILAAGRPILEELMQKGEGIKVRAQDLLRFLD